MTTTTTATGALRAECDYCTRTTRPRLLEPGCTRIELPAGWSVAPYSATALHATGRRGDVHLCPDCERSPQRRSVPRYEPGYPEAFTPQPAVNA